MTTTRTLLIASMLTVGCTIHLHVEMPPEELARLRAPAPVKDAVTAVASSRTPAVERRRSVLAEEPERVTEHCPLDDAQAAYVDGDYVGALQKAVHSNHAGWRIIAATACALHDEQWVSRAVENLNPLERGWLQNVCGRQGLVLTDIDTEHPRIVRTAAFDEDEE